MYYRILGNRGAFGLGVWIGYGVESKHAFGFHVLQDKYTLMIRAHALGRADTQRTQDKTICRVMMQQETLIFYDLR